MMSTSLVNNTPTNEFYVTHAEFQDCFIKIWASICSNQKKDMDKSVQNFNNYTKELTKLDLYGNTMYVHICKTGLEVKLFRCQVLFSDLETKTHTILLIDYGMKIVASYCDVREVITDNIDKLFLNRLSQKASIHTFILSTYISKSKSNNELINILCNKHYKYRSDFIVGGIEFVTLHDIDKRLIDSGIVDIISVATMNIIANSLSSTITSNFKNDVVKSSPIPSNAPMLYSSLKSQNLVCGNPINVNITRVSMDNNSILLTVQTVNKEFENLNNMLNSIDRLNLKLTPVIEVYTPCLIAFRNKLVRVIILDVQIDNLFVDMVDYGIRSSIPRTSVFEIPPNCNLIEMRSLNVILDKPNHVAVDKSIFVQKYFQMLPLKMDPSFGLYKVKLFKKINEEFIDIFDVLTNIGASIINTQCSVLENSSEFISITEINEEMKSIENTAATINYETSLHHLSSNQIKEANVESKAKQDLKNHNNQTEKENVVPKEKEIVNHMTPIMFLTKENLNECQEIVGSLIYYKSPFNFKVRQYNSNFESFMNEIESNLNSRYILMKCDIVKNMYVIYQNQSNFIYRAQVIDMDSEINNIKLQLVDEGDRITKDIFNKITLYNFIESDCHLPGQLVLDCSLNNMWFPIINVDTTLMLKPYFNNELLYKVKVVKTDESGVKLVQMFKNDTNIDISDIILTSGIGQRLCAAVKTDETPYEASLFIGQIFLSYVYYYHFKLCIQPEPNTVDELEEEILEYIRDNNPESLDVSNLQGTYCLATVNFSQWYRAFVTNVNEEFIIVNMFDIGLLTNVTLKQIRPIARKLMKKPQLCLNCNFEAKDFNIKITEKTLYNVTVKSINTNDELLVTIKEHNAVPLPNPIVRGIEQISFVHVDGNLTYLQRSQDKLKIEKMSENLSKLNGELESNSSVVPGEVNVFKNHGKFYRCVIKSISSETAIVHCIDFGFEKQISKKKLQSLENSKISMLPALVTIVKTFPMASNLSETIFLANMHVDSDGTLNASPNKTSLIHSQNKLMESLTNGCLVKVTCVYSNDDCWIVPHLFLDKLSTISDILVKTQSKVIPAVMEIGSLCAALHSGTKTWHRALVLNENGDTENILSIDSGERFKALKITKLASEIQKIPNCALHCQVVSKVDVKELKNKNVKCKLVSFTKPLLEVELFSNDIDKTETVPTESIMEWLVTLIRFESFNEFYVEKINDKYCFDSSNVNIKLNTDNKSSEIYRCFLEEEINDCNLNDPKNLDKISDIMMVFEWTLKTSSDREPYKVTLTNDGLNCVDILHRILLNDNCKVPENGTLSENEAKTTGTCIESNVNMHTKLLMNNNNIVKKTSNENKIVLFNVEKVTVLFVETFKYFYVHSESLSTSYMQQINSELDVCIVELPINQSMVGSIVITSSQISKCWCRAKIINILTDQIGAYCYLLDLGYYEVCTEFYKPTDFLRTCPPLVRRCTLYTPQFDGKENEIWYPNIDAMFKDILAIDDLKLSMIIKENGDPCVVTLRLDDADADLSDMLSPIFAQVTYVHSLTNFKIRALCPKQKAVIELLEGIDDVHTELVENPITGNLYIAKIKSKVKRVKYNALLSSNVKYAVIDIDDTLDVFSVGSLYEVPEKIRDFPVFTMTCSFILDDKEDTYLLSMFQQLANPKLTFIACIITESDGVKPNLVKLYYNNKDILDIIKCKDGN